MKISTTPEAVKVTLSTEETALAVKHQLEIPTSAITSVTAEEPGDLPKEHLLKLPGTRIPGVIQYGSYGTGDRREFWAEVAHHRVLVIDAEGWDYHRLVLGIDNPDQAAATINAALSPPKS